MVGGTTAETAADSHTQQLTEGCRQQIVDALAKEAAPPGIDAAAPLEAVAAMTQVVAGTNHFVKARLGDVWLLLRIFEPLPHTSEPPSLTSLRLAEESTQLSYF